MKISISVLDTWVRCRLRASRNSRSVISIDVDPVKLELIRTGKTPVVEEV